VTRISVAMLTERLLPVPDLGRYVSKYRNRIVLKIVYQTQYYRKEQFQGYINKAVSNTPEKDIKGIHRINIYDSTPKHFPNPAKGGYYPASKTNGAVIDLYLDENLGHMLTFHKNKNFITKFFDQIFIKLFGKIFIIHTLLHEFGHFVHDINAKKKNKRSKSSQETFADNYAYTILNKIYPFYGEYQLAINRVYRYVYMERINHDNKAGKRT
jgi:hypothetical protein